MTGAIDLSKMYIGVEALDRRRCRPDQVPQTDPEVLQALYERRRRSVADYQPTIDAALKNPSSDRRTVEALKGIDLADLTAMTPRQAAFTEITLEHRDGFGRDAEIGVWNHARGVVFTVEAFIWHLGMPRWANSTLLDHLTPARQLLDLVRSAPDDVHAAAMAVAAGLRAQTGTGYAFARTVPTFLFPERSDWLEEDLDAARRTRIPAASLVPSVATAEQAALVGELMLTGPKRIWNGDEAVELAFLQVAGDQALPFLLAWHDGRPEKGTRLSEPKERAQDLISRIPGDAALRALAERDTGSPETFAYLHAAAERFPDSALRVLPSLAPTRTLTHVLTAVVVADPDRARAVLPELPAEVRTRLETVLGQGMPSVAPPEQLPAILLRPPWSDPAAKRPKPVVIAGLTPPAGVETTWQPGERERWLGRRSGWEPSSGWPAIAEQIAAWRAGPVRADDSMTPVALYFAAYAPPDLVRPLLADGWLPPLRRADERAYAFVARYEVLAIPAVQAIRGLPASRGRLLQPFVSAEIAATMAESMTRHRSAARGPALGWLRRHPESAVRCLVPAALGKAAPARRAADAALRRLAAEGIDVAGAAAAAYGAESGVAVKDLMADGGLGAYPRTRYEVPMWAKPSVLPAIRLKDGSAVLPPRAAETVVEMLQISKPEAPYAGLEIVKELCDGSSLGEFVFAVSSNWRDSGSDAAHRWAGDAMGLLGDDGTVDRLEPLIATWTTLRHYSLVSDALSVLGMIGGDRALAALHSVVQKGRRKAVRCRAEVCFQEVAESLDLAPEELADRVVPTLGLGTDGTLRLDYGPRRFAVGFDELLRPRVTDEAGKVLGRMPRPVKTDDQERAQAAYQQYAEVKRTAQTIATDQIRRLETALFTRRRWAPEDFAAHVVAHPLLRHLTRRLVWGVYAADGSAIGSFRIAEDLSYADIHDAHYEIPDGAVIGIAHPVELGPAVAGWSEVFADYEILQPLDQLGRPVLELTAGERAGRMLERFQRVALDQREIRALEIRGWYSGPVGDPPVWTRFLRPLDDDRYLIIDITPGMRGGVATGSDYQFIDKVWLSVAGEDASFDLHSVPFSELGSVPASEILWDLAEVTGR